MKDTRKFELNGGENLSYYYCWKIVLRMLYKEAFTGRKGKKVREQCE